MKRAWKLVWKIVLTVGMAAAVTALMLWLAGTFHRKVGSKVPPIPPGPPVGAAKLATVQLRTVPLTESAVGTIRPVLESAVASKVMEKVLAVDVTAGQAVRNGQVLVRLDDTLLKAQLGQAQAAEAAALAARNQAQVELAAVTKARAQNAATAIELDRAQTALKSAQADLQRAQQQVAEAKASLAYATIRSPMNAIVIDKKVNVGDTVVPGQVVVTLYDPLRMQLVASVPEGLAHRLHVGQDINAIIESMNNKACTGKVSEIVPEAQAASRTFLVKVTGPCQPGMYTGMFGRIIIPLGHEQVLMIPHKAVRRIGQLHMVEVAKGGFLLRRAVQLGRSFDGDVQVLSGLRAGEKVAADAAGAVSHG